MRVDSNMTENKSVNERERVSFEIRERKGRGREGPGKIGENSET